MSQGGMNQMIDNLDREVHIPGYQFCGPGTKLEERLARGEKGINKLDAACRAHDIMYSKFKDDESRKLADLDLSQKAKFRVMSKDATGDERTAALSIARGMVVKDHGILHEMLSKGMTLSPLGSIVDVIDSRNPVASLIPSGKEEEKEPDDTEGIIRKYDKNRSIAGPTSPNNLPSVKRWRANWAKEAIAAEKKESMRLGNLWKRRFSSKACEEDESEIACIARPVELEDVYQYGPLEIVKKEEKKV